MNLISKLILPVAAIIAATGISFAQSFTETPNDTINIIGLLDNLETLTIQPLNISSDTITLKWKKVSESVPALWDASVCDNGSCYGTLVDSGLMMQINPTGLGLLLLHITPHVNYGTAIVSYAVWDIANPNFKDTLTYILTVNATSGIASTENKNDFDIFPNPANENLNLVFADNKKHHIEIYNSRGEIILSETLFPNCTLPIENWNNGLYIVSIFENEKIINSYKIMVQK